MKTFFTLTARTLLIISVLVCFMSFSPNEQKDGISNVLNNRMKEQFAELKQVAGYNVESFTDEKGYLAIKIVFNQTALPNDKYSKAFSRSARTPIRNISSSLLSWLGTDINIKVYAKTGSCSTTATALRDYFIKDGIQAKRIKAAGIRNANSNGRVEISIKTTQRMIQDARNGISLD